jgi:Asp-tRNA(Asn)/Glu-tRNA(Gln) amidotransferase A subunit family amidase
MPDLRSQLPHAPRIGFCKTSRWNHASSETRIGLETAASSLALAGAEVQDLALPEDFDLLYDEQELIMNFEAARSLADERFRYGELLSEHLRSKLQEHWKMPRSRYDDAMRHARECRLAYRAVFSELDVLLTPSAPGEALKGIDSTGSSLFNRNWTLLGAPCVTLPFGRSENGLPLAIQIVGRYDDDTRMLQVAEWVKHKLA